MSPSGRYILCWFYFISRSFLVPSVKNRVAYGAIFALKSRAKNGFTLFKLLDRGGFCFICVLLRAPIAFCRKKRTLCILSPGKNRNKRLFFVDAAKNMTFLLNFCTSAVKRQKKLCCFCAIRTLNPDVNCGKKILFVFCKNVQIFYRAVKIYLLFKSKINKNSCILRKNIV